MNHRHALPARIFACAIAAILLILAPGAPRAQNTEKAIDRGLAAITPAGAYELCTTIASEKFAGRLTGDEGYTLAARWAAKKFEEWGLGSLDAKDGRLQAYPSPYTLVDEAGMSFLIPVKGDKGETEWREWRLAAPKDFLPHLFTASGDTTAPLVFAGWAISAPELGYDDYAGIDPAGEFVLCFRGTPDRDDKRFTDYDQHRHRMKTAQEKGALGLIYIYEEPQANPNGDWIRGFMSATVSEGAADSLLSERGVKAADLKGDLEHYRKPLSFPIEARMRFRAASRHFPDGVGYNVAGFLEGSDPKLRTELVVIGGHYDGCGRHIGMTFPGADDNASGSAVVMEIAEAFAKAGRAPKRSVAFVLFGGEEKGLEGSTFFADHVSARFARIDAMFNYDMTGEGDAAGAGCGEGSPELKSCIEAAGARVKAIKSIWLIKEVGVRSSDFAPFFLKGAACATLYSNGPHLHYHLPGDTIYRINPDMLADCARIGFVAAYRWADR